MIPTLNRHERRAALAAASNGKGLLLADGTEVRQVDENALAQRMALDVAKGLSAMPLDLLEVVTKLDRWAAQQPAGLQPIQRVNLECVRMVARWQVEARAAIKAGAQLLGMLPPDDGVMVPEHAYDVHVEDIDESELVGGVAGASGRGGVVVDHEIPGSNPGGHPSDNDNRPATDRHGTQGDPAAASLRVLHETPAVASPEPIPLHVIADVDANAKALAEIIEAHSTPMFEEPTP